MYRRHKRKNYLYTDLNSRYIIILYYGILIYIPKGIRDFLDLLSQEEIMINIATLFTDDDLFESTWYYYGSILDALHIIDVNLIREKHLQHFISWLCTFRYFEERHINHEIMTLVGTSWTIMSAI